MSLFKNIALLHISLDQLPHENEILKSFKNLHFLHSQTKKINDYVSFFQASVTKSSLNDLHRPSYKKKLTPFTFKKINVDQVPTNILKQKEKNGHAYFEITFLTKNHITQELTKNSQEDVSKLSLLNYYFPYILQQITEDDLLFILFSYNNDDSLKEYPLWGISPGIKRVSHTKRSSSNWDLNLLLQEASSSQKTSFFKKVSFIPTPQEILSMNSIIRKKKYKKELNKKEINFFINQVVEKKAPDYQVSALLMAIRLNGLSKKEIHNLTTAMMTSGTLFPFNESHYIDKHSTGGVGDKLSFILNPLAAHLGVKIPMIAGGSLGFTGGTTDKLQSIPGFTTNLTMPQIIQQMDKAGTMMIGQSPSIVPADRILYALRDVTETVDSIPLITASIMSKKLSEGISGLVMDIKVGNGALMKTLGEAKKLARSLIHVAKNQNVKLMAIVTDVSQPLGHYVGHSLEVIESIETLKGHGPHDLTYISVELAASMLYLSGLERSFDKAKKKIKKSIGTQKVLNNFKKLIRAQGGNNRIISNYNLLPKAKLQMNICAKKQGYISSFSTSRIGEALREIGGGRKNLKDKIDYGAGFYFHKKIGDKVKINDHLVTVFYNPPYKNKIQALEYEFLENIISIQNKKVTAPKLIYEKFTSWS